MLNLYKRLFVDLIELVEPASGFNFAEIQMPLVFLVDISFINPERVSLE